MLKEKVLKISTIVAAASIFCGINSFNGYNRADKELKKHPNYNAIVRLEKAANELHGAINALDYRYAYVTFINMPIDDKGHNMQIPVTHPEEYPNAAEARKDISGALKLLGNKGDTEYALRSIRNYLPEQSCVEKFKGKNVDDLTFKPQQKSIQSIIDSLIIEKKELIPYEMLHAKDKNAAKLAIYGCVGLLSSVTALISFLDKRKCWEEK